MIDERVSAPADMVTLFTIMNFNTVIIKLFVEWKT